MAQYEGVTVYDLIADLGKKQARKQFPVSALRALHPSRELGKLLDYSELAKDLDLVSLRVAISAFENEVDRRSKSDVTRQQIKIWYAALSVAMEKMGINILSLGQFQAMAVSKNFIFAIPINDLLIEDWVESFNASKKVRARESARQCALDCLFKMMKNAKWPITLNTVAAQFHTLSAAVEMQLPQYRSNGMLRMTIST